MVYGRIIGTIVSTRKVAALVGSKFMEVELYSGDAPNGNTLVAVDTVGAGIGEKVLVTTGSPARLAVLNQSAPVDAAIVGIIDEE